MYIRKFINFSGKQFLSEKHLKGGFFMYYKIREYKQNGNFLVTRNKFYYDQFRFEVKAKRVLQFDSALLVYDGKEYSLYLASSTRLDEPTLIVTGILQYRAFSNRTRQQNYYILALQIGDFWTFLVPESFRYFIDNEKIRIGRTEKLPKIFIANNSLPAYFKKGFRHTQMFVFHANGKDYLIHEKNISINGTESQIKITEFKEITPLLSNGYFKAIDENGEYLFHQCCSYGPFAKLEEFAEKDYPEIFTECYGYWGKNSDGNILFLFITGKNNIDPYPYTLDFFEKPAKSVHFYDRTYTDTISKYYYDIWQVTDPDGQKRLRIETLFDSHHPVADIDENAWNF